jgi:hypothetical protein
MQLMLFINDDELRDILSLYCQAKFNKPVKEIKFSTTFLSDTPIQTQIFFEEEKSNV